LRFDQPDRQCSGGCGTVLPVGYRHNLCKACDHDYRQQTKERARKCTWCGERVYRGEYGYLCRLCKSIQAAEQRNEKRKRKEIR
jgi:hypothetical protein